MIDIFFNNTLISKHDELTADLYINNINYIDTYTERWAKGKPLLSSLVLL